MKPASAKQCKTFVAPGEKHTFRGAWRHERYARAWLRHWSASSASRPFDGSTIMCNIRPSASSCAVCEVRRPSASRLGCPHQPFDGSTIMCTIRPSASSSCKVLSPPAFSLSARLPASCTVRSGIRITIWPSRKTFVASLLQCPVLVSRKTSVAPGEMKSTRCAQNRPVRRKADAGTSSLAVGGLTRLPSSPENGGPFPFSGFKASVSWLA